MSRQERTFWYVLALAAIAGTAYGWLLANEPGSLVLRAMQISLHLATAAGYAISVSICAKIAADHKDHSSMRMAWLLIGGSAGFAVVRHAFESLSFATGWVHTNVAMVSLRQVPIFVSLILLAMGLMAMWSSFMSIGMGLRFAVADLLVMALLLLLVPATFALRQGMSDSSSAFPLVRYLQSASPILLAIPASISLVLHRISKEMGGGRLALSLRLMAAFLVVRLLSLFVSLFPEFPTLTMLSRTLFWGTVWLFLLAVVCRWQVTVSASQMAARYEADPDAELAGVSEALRLGRGSS